MLTQRTIGFIGAGSMAEAILAGLLAKNEISATQISMMNRSDEERLVDLIGHYGLDAGKQTAEHVLEAEVVILAVKPKDVAEVLKRWGSRLKTGQLLISVVAGVSTALIESHLAEGVAVIRVMPNTSCAVGMSATAVCKGNHVGQEQLRLAECIFRSVGSVIVVDEAAMDAVTGLSGSGPAYFYYLVEALEAAGIEAGLPRETARELTLQTLLGAAHMLVETGKEAEQLRREVTSPGGTTMAGLEVLSEYQVAEAMKRAVLSAKERSREMEEQLIGNLC